MTQEDLLGKINYLAAYRDGLLCFIETKSGARKCSVNDYGKITNEISRVSEFMNHLRDVLEINKENNN